MNNNQGVTMPTYQSILSNPNVSTAQNSLNTANGNLNTAQNTYNGISAGSSTFADALKQALMNKFNGNQDLVNGQSKAFNQYLNAAGNARNEYSNWGNQMAQGAGQGVINPYATNDAVQSSINNAYSNYSNANSLLNQRVGTINDLVKSGGDIYQGEATNAQNAVNTASQAQKQAQDLYSNAYQQAQADYQNQLAGYNAYTSGQANLGMAKYYAGGGPAALYGNNAQTATYSPEQYGNAAYSQWLTANKISEAGNNPYDTQNNLYKFLNSATGGTLSPDQRNALWQQWQQADSAYKRVLSSQQELKSMPKGYTGPTIGGIFGAVGRTGDSLDSGIRNFLQLPQNNGWGGF